MDGRTDGRSESKIPPNNFVVWGINIIFIQENKYENVVCEMAAILSWPQCVQATLYLLQIC